MVCLVSHKNNKLIKEVVENVEGRKVLVLTFRRNLMDYEIPMFEDSLSALNMCIPFEEGRMREFGKGNLMASFHTSLCFL